MLVPTTVSDAQIRARAGLSCECAGECGATHPRGRCRVGASGSRALNPMVIRDGKQYCGGCEQRLFLVATKTMEGIGTLKWGDT